MSAEAPSIEAMSSWLRSAAVLAADGAVLSWDNPAHPGYAYPEAAGLLLSLLSLDGERFREPRERIAARLIQDVSPAGGVGRGSCDYVFDTAVALAALLAHARAGAELPDPRLPGRLLGFLAETLGERRALRGEGTGPAGHWSRSYSCHLLKVVIALGAYHDVNDDARCVSMGDTLFADLSPLCQGGRFTNHAGSGETYVHAHCYAVEGLIDLHRRGQRSAGPLAEAGAAWLAREQDPSGGLRAFHDGRRAHGPLRADATAQAVRIWASLDRRAHASSIAAALTFLGRLQSPAGGLRYDTTTDDINTWATIFAVHALRLLRDEGGSRSLI